MMKSIDEKVPLFIPLWLVWVAAFGFVLWGLGDFGLLNNNEGLYAEISREMLASHDWRLWVIPHLNGLPYLEKPPLLYWLTALSFTLFGQSEWAARLAPALSSLSCVAMLLWFGKTLNRPQVGRLAALMFVSGTGVIAMSHVLMFDMLLTALLTAALMFAFRYLREKKPWFLRRSYAFLALAVLAKGFVALILYGLIVAGMLLASERSISGFFRACANWLAPRALLVFFIIAAPWHIVASATEPIFSWFYFTNEHLLRFLGKREPRDYYSGNWWYYLPRMALYLFPWSFLPLGLIGARLRKLPPEPSLPRFLLIAWLAPLLFFSISSAKANYYLVAVMPFAAFHLATAIEERGFLFAKARLAPGVAICVLTLILLAAFAMRADDGSVLRIWGIPQRAFLQYLFGGIAVLALAAGLCAQRIPRVGIIAYLVLPVWIAAGAMAVQHAMEPQTSTRQLSNYLKSELPDRTVYLYRNFEELSSLPFYLKHPVPVVDTCSNDLFWGNKLRANEIVISKEQFLAALEKNRAAIVVMQRQLGNFKAAGLAGLFKGDKRIGDTTVFFN